MSGIEHWTTPSGYDLQRQWGSWLPDGAEHYVYRLVFNTPLFDLGQITVCQLTESEFEALRAVSREGYNKDVLSG